MMMSKKWCVKPKGDWIYHFAYSTEILKLMKWFIVDRLVDHEQVTEQ